MDEFLVELQAKLNEAKSKGNINDNIRTLQGQLNKLKVQAEIDQDTISKLTKEIEKVINKKITISNIEVDTTQAVKSAQKTGKQIGEIISDAAGKSINNVSSKNIGKYFKVNPSDSKQFQNEMEKLVNGWTKGKGKVKDISIQTRTSYDEKSGQNVERLHQALVIYENELNEVIKKTIAWRQIGTKTNSNGEEEALHGFVEVAGQYSKSLDSVSVKTDNFAKKQKETIANMQNTIKQIESGAYDKNSSRPITSDDSLNKLDTQLAYVENAMYDLKHATAETFDDARIRVQNEISDLKILTRELRNTDNVSNKMKGTDLSSGLSIAKNDLEKFKSDAKDFSQITKTIKDLDSAISNVGDTASLNAFNDQLRVARSELAKIKSETNAVNREEKVGINISGLQSKIADLQRISPEIDKFKAEINGAEVTVQTLYSDLEKVNTQSDLSVIKEKWKAFTDAAKSAGIAVVEVRDKYDSLLRKIDGEITSYKYQNQSSKITDRYNKIDSSLIDESLKNDYKELINLSNELNISMGNDDKINAYNRLAELIPSIKNRLAELQSSQNQLNEINNIKDLVNGKTKNDYSTQIAKIGGNFRSIGFSQKDVDEKLKSANNAFDALRQKLSQPFDKNNYQEIISLNDKLQKELAESSNEYTKLQASTKGYVSIHQRLTKANTIEAWNQKNTKATKEAIATNQAYIDSLRNLNAQMTQMDYDEISIGFKRNENSMRGMNRLGASLKSQFTEAAQGFSQWLSVSSGVMFAVSKTKDAITEIKNLDDILTEISKTSDLTSSQLKQLGMDAYDSASKYGRTASDFLLGVQEMARSGFYGEKGTGMAEQSLLAQASGDMSAELANNYVLATNAAYKLNGEAEKINAVLDGQNSITNRNSVAMSDMATAMSEAGTVASSYRVSIEDLSAMIGTIESVTKLGGSEVGNAIKAILINLQNVTSDKMVDTLDAANASMTEMVNGAEKLRNPIDILRDLAKTFNQLDENDPLRAEILTNVGQKYHAAKLGALLQNMDMFDKMLVDYSEGSGSALEEANKSANNLTGTLNKLSNSWNELVNSLVNSDGLKFGVSLLDSLVQGATKLVSVLTPLGTIGVGAGLFTGFKNTGKCRISVRIS